MTVLKLTSSKKGVMVVDDEGNVFITSLTYFKSLLDGTLKSGFILMQRLPEKASDSRFVKSPLFGNSVERKAASASVDSLSVARSKEKHEEKLFEDKTVW